MTIEYQEGFDHYSKGYIDECPYDEGSAAYEQWMSGYDDASIEAFHARKDSIEI